VLFFSVRGNLAAAALLFHLVLVSQLSDEPFIFVRGQPTQFVIEMNHGENNADFLAKIQQQAKQCDRVRSS
jgi:hypothetical protein